MILTKYFSALSLWWLIIFFFMVSLSTKAVMYMCCILLPVGFGWVEVFWRLFLINARFRLRYCCLTRVGCTYVVLAVKSNPSSLRELDFIGNEPWDSVVRLLSDFVKNPHFRLETLRSVNVDVIWWISSLIGQILLLAWWSGLEWVRPWVYSMGNLNLPLHRLSKTIHKCFSA